MLVKGFLVNNTGRYTYIFKQAVRPGQRIPLKSLYDQYKYKCKCEFDEKFIAWLKNNKIPGVSGWDFEDIETKFDAPITVVGKVVDVEERESMEDVFSNLTSAEISNLRVKDKPNDVLKNVDSVTKLRRAMTLAKLKKGKVFLVKGIKSRINELTKE